MSKQSGFFLQVEESRGHRGMMLGLRRDPSVRTEIKNGSCVSRAA